MYVYVCNIVYSFIGGGIDYNSGPYNVTFPIGSVVVLFDILINNDNVFEKNERFSVHINSITNGHIVGVPETARVTIMDNDSKYFINCIIYA